ncbi:MAG: transposase, partial [Candidatus Heimdallarchaeota archaeon]|nr:transposase [Candidatus Heimdallarchaeota archaeon]
MLTYKVQLYPNKQQQATLIEQLDICRKLYNKLLEECKKAREKGEKLTQIKTQSFIVGLKNNSMPELKEVHSKVLQMVNYTLWANIKSLSKLKKNGRKTGHLRFKGKGWYKTINYNQSGFKIDENKNKITFSKIGTINCRGLNNRVRKNKIKGIILKRSQMGRWFANIQVENTPIALPKTNKSVGLDVGISSFIVDSDGRRVENPKNIDKQLKKIKISHRTLSRKKKGSKNWLKAKVQLAKLLAQVTNQRKDFLHKVSRFYVNVYDLMCVEDLNIKGLTQKGNKNNKRSRTLHRNILDASWGQFFN